MTANTKISKKTVAKKTVAKKNAAPDVSAEIKYALDAAEEREISLSLIDRSPTQPRKIFDENAIIELAESIVIVGGLMHSITVRPKPEGRFELIAGERRFRAHQYLKREQIRARIAELSDEQVYEMQIHENLHRVDLEPLEEAESYLHLLENARFGGKPLTNEELALRVKKPVRYVVKQLTLNNLFDEAKDDLRHGRLPLALAYELATLSLETQKQAYEFCFDETYDQTAQQWIPDKDEPQSVSHLREKLLSDVYRRLDRAPFPVESADLHPLKGSCLECGERTGANLLFAEMEINDSCLNAFCFAQKAQTFVQIQTRRVAQEKAVAELAPVTPPTVEDAESGETVPVAVELTPEIESAIASKTDEYAANVALITNRWHSENPEYLGRDSYETIHAAAQDCEFSETAVFGEGSEIGTTRLICRNRKCQKHHSTGSASSSSAPVVTPDERRERKNELVNIRAADLARKTVLKRALKNISAADWQDPYFQNLICATLLNLLGDFSHQKRYAVAFESLNISAKDFALAKKSYHTDIDTLALAEKVAVRTEDDRAKLAFALAAASFGENFLQTSVVPQDAVRQLAELKQTDYGLADAEARVALTRERPDYKKFLLVAEQYLNEYSADDADRDRLQPPVFFE